MRQYLKPYVIECHVQKNFAGESTFVFRDSAFADDVAKINQAVILKQHSLEIVRSLQLDS